MKSHYYLMDRGYYWILDNNDNCCCSECVDLRLLDAHFLWVVRCYLIYFSSSVQFLHKGVALNFTFFFSFFFFGNMSGSASMIHTIIITLSYAMHEFAEFALDMAWQTYFGFYLRFCFYYTFMRWPKPEEHSHNHVS